MTLRQPRTPTRLVAALLLLLMGAGFVASGASPVMGYPIDEETDAGSSTPDVLELPVEETAPGATNRYFVVLEEPPLAQYRGGITGLAPTAVDAVAADDATDGRDRGAHLDTTTDDALAYIEYLESVQDSYIQRVRRIAPEFKGQDWQYQIALNGFVAEMTPMHAMEVMRLPGVRLVYPEEHLLPEMDSTAQLLNTITAWEAAGGPEEAGAGARVAVLEPGNAIDHPWFHDEGMPEPPPGFPSAKVYGAGGDEWDMLEPERLLNNKIIGARVIVQEVVTENLGSYSTSLSNHGRHTSGTTTGRHGVYDASDLGVPGLELEMGGVSPMSFLFHYYNADGTPGMVKSYEIMIKDEIDAVNLSLGQVGWLLDRPDKHPIGIAMSAAADAGVMTVASSGNAGVNGRTSLSGGWKYSEDIMVVGNTTTTGSLTSEVDLEGADVPDDMTKIYAGPPRGIIAITEPIKADLILPDNGGCPPEPPDPDPQFEGKIAVIERFGPAGSSDPIGGCAYQARAQYMADSGAIATIYIYYNTYLAGGSGTALALPTVAMGAKYGIPLVEFLRGGGEAEATIYGETKRSYVDMPDLLSASSSQGPGLDWNIKPDITAPGTNIVSSVLVDDDGTGPLPPRGGFAAYSGTSMAAPHVNGAAGLLRSFNPTWTVPQMRSALINTSLRVVQVGSFNDLRPAKPTEAGPGRLDLAYAYDPGAFLSPPKASFGRLDIDAVEMLDVIVSSATEETMEWAVSLEHLSGDAAVTVEPESFKLAADESITLTVTIDTTGVAESEHWGDVHLHGMEAPDIPTIYLPAMLKDAAFDADEMPLAGRGDAPAGPAQGDDDEDGKERNLRLVYYAFVDIPDNRADVLVVNWTYGSTEDYTPFYTDALDELGLSYNVWSMGDAADGHEDRKTIHPTFEEMYRHDLVILNANMSRVSLQQALAGVYQYQNMMLAGGSLLIAGQGTQDWWGYLGGNPLADTQQLRDAYGDTWPYRWFGLSQNGGCEMCLARYFAGFTYEYTSTLSGRLLVPYPERPDTPEMEVVLQPHADAEGVFDYSLDISTGALAKEGAAGNQYSFASGEVADGYKPPQANAPYAFGQWSAGMGDTSYAELVIDRIAPYAKPLWSYPVSDTMKVVGTYVAGKNDSEADVAWNAMFWGFGLEGVGAGSDDTVGRVRLLGDTFNFMARSMAASANVLAADADGVRVGVALGEASDVPLVASAEVDWGDGDVVVETFDPPVPADSVTFAHRFADDGAHPVSIKLVPAAGQGTAPIYVDAELLPTTPDYVAPSGAR